MSAFLQVLGGIVLVIFVVIAALLAFMAIGSLVQMWTRRRYSNIWRDLHPEGHYTVLKVLWNDGGHIGLLLFYNEPHAAGHALYACRVPDRWAIPREGDCLLPSKYSGAIPPFDIERKKSATA